MAYHVSFGRMYPDDYVETYHKMPHQNFVGEDKEYYEKVIRTYNKTVDSFNKAVKKEDIKPASSTVGKIFKKLLG